MGLRWRGGRGKSHEGVSRWDTPDIFAACQPNTPAEAGQADEGGTVGDTEPAGVETKTGSTGAGASSTDSSTGRPPASHCGHRTNSHDWALPALGLPLRYPDQPLPRIGGRDHCEGGGQFWFKVLDVDGDGFPDLVVFRVYSACTDQTVGKVRWIIYPVGRGIRDEDSARRRGEGASQHPLPSGVFKPGHYSAPQA